MTLSESIVLPITTIRSFPNPASFQAGPNKHDGIMGLARFKQNVLKCRPRAMAIPIKSLCFPWHQLLMVSFPSKTAFHLLFGKQEGFPGKAKMKELWTPLEGFPIVSSGSTGPGFNASGRELTSRRGRGVQHQELWRLHGACRGDHEAFCRRAVGRVP